VADTEHDQPLRLVLDTNIVVSALLWQGAPRRLLQLATDNEAVMLFTSAALIDELRNTLGYRKFEKRLADAGSSVEDVIALYKSIAEIIIAAPPARWVPRDQDDDIVVATAVGGSAHAIVSGDRDLLDLEQVAGMIVLKASEAIELIEGRG
jgi:putative PIN family toxin of toxin-antitoxin system